MSLEQQIQDQYRKRVNTEAVYNSVYARSAEKERFGKAVKLVRGFLSAPVSVFEVGAGQGHNVPMLRACGFSDIVLNELLPDRVAIAKKNYPELKVLSGNFLQAQIGQKFDCVFQSTVFTSVLNADDRMAMAGKMWELLRPGGIILWYDFVYNNPKNKEVRRVSRHELKALFPEASVSKITKVTLAPPIGRRVGGLYSLLNIPLLRSHILAVFQKRA